MFNKNNPILLPEEKVRIKDLPMTSEGNYFFVIPKSTFLKLNVYFITVIANGNSYAGMSFGNEYVNGDVEIMLPSNTRGYVTYQMFRRSSIGQLLEDIKLVDPNSCLIVDEHNEFTKNGTERHIIAELKGIAKMEIEKNLMYRFSFENMLKVKFTCFINCNKVDENFIKNCMYYAIISSKFNHKLTIK